MACVSYRGSWRGVLAVLVLACSTGHEQTALVTERLDADVEWRHCAAERYRDLRPSWPCLDVQLIASGKDVVVPEGGVLEVSLDREALPAGPAALSVEAVVYPEGDTTLAAQWEAAIGAFEKILRKATHDRALEHAFARLLAFEPAVPKQRLNVREVPERLSIRLPDVEPGRTMMYAVWAWPSQLDEDMQLTLAPIVPAVGDGLAIAVAAPEPTWTAGSAPIRLDVVAEPTGGTPRVLWTRRINPAIRVAERGWQEAEIDLTSLVGQEVAFRLVARLEGDHDGVGFALWARPLLLRRVVDDRPNLILVSLDTLRADHLGTYGYERPTSPAIDRMAGESVVFDQATSTFPSTTASHMSMLTSLYPCAHGLLAPGSTLGKGVVTVAQALATGGYRTAAITENALIVGDIGFNRGFDSYQDLKWLGGEPTGIFQEGAALARQWIAGHDSGPFFMFLHTYEPHEPFKVPPQHRAAFVLPDSAPELRRLESEYDAGIRGTDDVLMDFVGWLERRGLLERTVLVVTSDHGTEFGEHGGRGHALGVYAEQNHVPLLFRYPSLKATGSRIPMPVSLIDLAPTLLAFAEVAPPSTFAGRSLLASLHGESIEPQPVYSEQMWGKRQTLLRKGKWAWLETKSGLELYDMGTDPTQQHDLAATDAEVAARGAEEIRTFRQACHKIGVRLQSKVAAPPLDAEREQALRALGYLE